MTNFSPYRRSQIAELRPWYEGDDMSRISVSAPDREAGSPKQGDMIARNPVNHDDQWLVAEKYFAANFEAAPGAPGIIQHASDCAVHSEPAYPAGPCNCGVERERIARKCLLEPTGRMEDNFPLSMKFDDLGQFLAFIQAIMDESRGIAPPAPDQGDGG